MTFFTSASFLVLSASWRSSWPSTLTIGLVVRCVKSFCSASGLPLYFAAVSLKAGPRTVELDEHRFVGFDDPMFQDYAQKHFDVVDRFGRFPHRNEALGRATRADEEAAIEEGKHW